MRQIITLIIVLLRYMVMQAVMPGAPAAPVAEQPDTIVIIQGETVPAPDDIYGDESVVIERLAGDSTTVLTTSDYAAIASCGSVGDQLKRLGDTSHNVKPGEFIIPAGIITVAALFAKVPVLRTWRDVIQNTISHHGKDKTPVDNWLQYSPMVASYVMQFAGYKGQHDLLDRTILLAMSYATFGVVNIALKSTVREKRPDSNARNSFPSGHTGTTFMGAEYLRREYWDKNKWVAMSGYLVGLGVAYMRIHNDRHWVNDVVRCPGISQHHLRLLAISQDLPQAHPHAPRRAAAAHSPGDGADVASDTMDGLPLRLGRGIRRVGAHNILIPNLI